jgi:hypothetical protein
MAFLLAFTDACPQEYLDTSQAWTWYTMAAIGVALEQSPFAVGLVAPSLDGISQVVRLPDPKVLAASLQPDATAPFRIWKNIRGEKRRANALERLLSACRAGRCVFLSHSTLSQFADNIAQRYLAQLCHGFVAKPGLIGYPEYLVTCTPFGGQVFLERQRLFSLVWIVHCLRVFLQKSREVHANAEALFIHDNLPFNREEDIAVVRKLLNALDPGRIHFMTERNQFEFAPADNLAAATNDFIAGRDPTIQKWIWKDGRPKNFYMTMDEDNGTFARYI